VNRFSDDRVDEARAADTIGAGEQKDKGFAAIVAGGEI
jgi:hypothetical protein